MKYPETKHKLKQKILNKSFTSFIKHTLNSRCQCSARTIEYWIFCYVIWIGGSINRTWRVLYSLNTNTGLYTEYSWYPELFINSTVETDFRWDLSGFFSGGHNSVYGCHLNYEISLKGEQGLECSMLDAAKASSIRGGVHNKRVATICWKKRKKKSVFIRIISKNIHTCRVCTK